MNDGQFSGFRIAPGKNRVLFGRLGLRRNDVITAINGIPADQNNAFMFIEQLSSASEISLDIKRGGQDVNVMFSAAADSQ